MQKQFNLISSVPSFSFERVSAKKVHSWLDDSHEWAFLDVREEGVFDQGHPFWATNAPLSHLDVLGPQLVPKKSTPVLIMDDIDDGLADRAGALFSRLGYQKIQILERGLKGWREAGFSVHEGVHVPSKAFGEFIEHEDGTPTIDISELMDWKAQRKKFLLIDCRPYEEYHLFSLPESINCPGMELVNRAFNLVVDRDIPIVVHCAGRTRGIIAAQSLISLGVTNPVLSLRNGLADWYLKGHKFATQNKRVALPPTLPALSRSFQAVKEVAHNWGVQFIDASSLCIMQSDINRTLYLFDIRTAKEYEAGHFPEARHAPGGQLIQAFDSFVGTRSARIVLCDDTGVRASMTAMWLMRMGWGEIYVLDDELHPYEDYQMSSNESGDQSANLNNSNVSYIGVLELNELILGQQAVVLDLSSSLQFLKSHIPGSWFAVRARLAQALCQLPSHKYLVLTCGDGKFAQRAYADAQALSEVPVLVLKGGNEAWIQSGQPMANGLDRVTSAQDDVWYSPLNRPDPVAAVKEYLKWEIALSEFIKSERGVHFLTTPNRSF